MQFNKEDIDIGERLRSLRENMRMTREEFSEKIEHISLTNNNISIIIGGSLGMTSEFLNTVNEKICFSKMTFPHQLIRIFLLEQLFRAFKISNNETYHR